MNIHTHSEYSTQDAIAKVSEIADKQKEFGCDYFCITDHGTMAAFPDAFKVANKKEMKFIPGIEIYLTPPEEFDAKKFVELKSELKKAKNKEKLTAMPKGWDTRDYQRNFHLTLIAKTQKGLENLFKIYSSGETYYKYRIPYQAIKDNKEDIIVLSGCLGGELMFYIKSKQYEKAEKLIKEYKETFGDDYYIEVQNHNIDFFEKDASKGYLQEKEAYIELIKMARANNVKMVATNDSHYVNESDNRLHTMYKTICYHKTEDQKRGELSFPGSGYHMLNAEEFKTRFTKAGYNLFGDVDSMIANIDEIANKVESGIDIPRAKNDIDSTEELRKRVMIGWNKIRKGTDREQQSLDQLNYELKIIENKKFTRYFINVDNIVKRARSLNILTGPGRGSGAGSEIVYLLGITKIDPLLHDLFFERFINPGRDAMPDIDIDIESSIAEYGGKLGSDVIVESMQDFYKFQGSIGNVVGGSAIVLFKKLAGFCGVPFAQSNKFTTNDNTKELLLGEKPTEIEFIEAVKSLGFEYDHCWMKTYREIDVCYRLAGIPTGSSIHASGRILSEENVILPKNDNDVINFNGGNLEAYGYTKYDLLSLETLNSIHDLFGLDIDWDFTDDPKAWEVLNNADTDYIFQFQGAIPKKMLKEVNITTIGQLSDITAINRPGPLLIGLHEKWIDVQNGKFKFEKEDAVLKAVLQNAFGNKHSGLLIYQEDVMKVCQEGSNFSLEEADNVRRAMGKKKKELIDSYKDQFVSDWKYNDIVEINGKGFLFDQDVKLTNGSIIKAKELFDRVSNGEEFDVEDSQFN